MLEIKLLGQFDTRVDGHSVALDSRQAQSLLAYLALHRDQIHRREKVAGLLWPDTSDKNARNNLRHVIWQINHTLGKHVYLRADRINIGLNPAAEIHIDAEALLGCKPDYVSVETLASTCASYVGELLPGFYDDWLSTSREAVNVAFEAVMHALLARLTADGRWRDVAAWAAHWIAKSFAPEAAYIALLTAHAELDEAASLTAAYRAYVDGLREQFGTQPPPEVVALYHRLRHTLEAKTARQNPADWADAPGARRCLGREREMSMLRHWLSEDDSRVVLVLGLGGIGKTTLATAAAREALPHFEGVVWRSLRNAPLPGSLVEDLLQALSPAAAQSQKTTSAKPFDQRLNVLLHLLRQQRMLVVLDNFESVLEGGTSAGVYRAGYGDYAQLLHALANSVHSSCTIVTSREKPAELAVAPGDSDVDAVRVVRLEGIDSTANREIVHNKALKGTAHEWDFLNQAYGGNPLAMKIVAEGIRELFDSDIGRYLSTHPAVFGNVRKLFDEQFARLTPLERDILLWLAIERESTTVERLQEDVLPAVPQSQILEAAQSLRERSLIEITSAGFTLQNVVMEYITERLIERAVAELRDGHLDVLRSHALIKASTSDYVRDAQVRLILQPVADQIAARLPQPHLSRQLAALLETERAIVSASESSYFAGNILNLLTVWGDVSGYRFTNLNVRQAYLRVAHIRDCDFSGAHFWRCAFAEQFVSLNACDISPDDRHVAIATRDEVRLWLMHNAQPHMTLRGHTDFVWNVAFDATGERVATASADGTVRLWDVATGETTHILDGLRAGEATRAGMWGVTFNDEGTLVAAGDEAGGVWLWDALTGQRLRYWLGHGGTVYSLTFDLPSNTLITGGGDGAVRLWHLGSGQCVGEFFHPEGEVRDITLTHDGTLASAGSDGVVRLWDMNTAADTSSNAHALSEPIGTTIPSIDFGPDGDVLACAGHDGTVRVWDVRQKRLRLVIRAHAQEARAVSLSKDGTRIISIGYDGAVRLWDARTGRALWTVRGYNQEVRSVAFSPDGKSLVSGSADYAVRIWDAAKGTVQRTITGHRRWVESVAVSPDGTHIASGSYDRTLRLWNAKTGRPVGSPLQHDRWVWSVAFSPNGRWVATGGVDGRVRLYAYDAEAPQGVSGLHHHLAGHERGVWRIQFNAQSTLLASASEDGTARVWHVETGECIQVLHCGVGVNSVAFTSDGTLTTASDDGQVRFWDVPSGKMLDTLQHQVHEVASLSLSRDGQWLASGSGDGSVHVWDVAQRTLHCAFHGHTAPTWSVAFHPLRPVVASGSLDGTIRLWNVETGECDAVLRADRIYERMNIANATGLTDAERTTILGLQTA